MRGPKARQMLQRDIKACITELKELERLRAVDDPIPTLLYGRLRPTDHLNIEQRSSVPLPSHHEDYVNFDGCMYTKGWERAHFTGHSYRG